MDPIISADRAWIKDLDHVISYGNMASPRGMKVVESLAYQSVVMMNDPVILNEKRKLGYKFMAAEAAWILSGDNRVKTIAPYSKDIAKFSDDGLTFFGAYGPKVFAQIPYVVSALHNDLDSRQAVINVWRETPPPTKDVPCTLSLQFLVRENVLHCVASMRSSDLWLGHPYDIVNFSAVAFTVLLQLSIMQGDELNLGYLFLTAGSKHIYERNFDGVKEVLDDFYGTSAQEKQRPERVLFNPKKFDDANEFIQCLWDFANTDIGIRGLYDV